MSAERLSVDVELKTIRHMVEQRVEICTTPEEMAEQTNALCALIKCVEKLVQAQAKFDKIKAAEEK